MKEAGLDFVVPFWTAVYAPARTPKAVVDKLTAALAQTMKSEDVTRRLAEVGTEAVGSTPAELDALTVSSSRFIRVSFRAILRLSKAGRAWAGIRSRFADRRRSRFSPYQSPRENRYDTGTEAWLRSRKGCAGGGPGDHVMTMNVTGMRIGVTVLALGVGLLALPNLAEAQRAAGIARVGWLEVCGPGPRRPHFDMFRARLASQGYVEGKNLVIEQRFADCRYDRMPGLAADLVQAPVDVLFTMGTRAARIVAATVKTTPLVVYRPAGNLDRCATCMQRRSSAQAPDELLKEAVPKVSRVMFLHDPEAAWWATGP